MNDPLFFNNVLLTIRLRHVSDLAYLQLCSSLYEKPSWPELELNPQPHVWQARALPLSYITSMKTCESKPGKIVQWTETNAQWWGTSMKHMRKESTCWPKFVHMFKHWFWNPGYVSPRSVFPVTMCYSIRLFHKLVLAHFFRQIRLKFTIDTISFILWHYCVFSTPSMDLYWKTAILCSATTPLFKIVSIYFTETPCKAFGDRPVLSGLPWLTWVPRHRLIHFNWRACTLSQRKYS